MIPSKIQALVAPFLLIPAQTCTLTGYLGQGFRCVFHSPYDNKNVGEFLTVLLSHHSR